MRFTREAVAGVLGILLVAGCELNGSRDPYAGYELGPARDAVAASVEAIGGLNAWRKVSTVRATAVVTLYDQAGTAYVDRQEHEIDLGAGRIVALGMAGRGSWRAEAYEDGRGGVTVSGAPMPAAAQKRLIEALSRLARRTGGPMNLLAGGERVRTARPVNVGGHDLVRVGVDGDNQRATAYYFTREGGLLRMVTEGADSPGKDGTVTQYTYKVLPNGLAFPARIRVVRIGRHVLVGSRPVMDVEFSNVRIN